MKVYFYDHKDKCLTCIARKALFSLIILVPAAGFELAT